MDIAEDLRNAGLGEMYFSCGSSPIETQVKPFSFE